MDEMSRADRFFAAVRLEQADRVPLFDFLFQQPLYEALIGRKPEAYNARDAVECALTLDNDGVWVPFGAFSGFRPGFFGRLRYGWNRAGLSGLSRRML